MSKFVVFAALVALAATAQTTPLHRFTFDNLNVASCEGFIGFAETVTAVADSCSNANSALRFGPGDQTNFVVRYPTGFFPTTTTDFTLAFRFNSDPVQPTHERAMFSTASDTQFDKLTISIGPNAELYFYFGNVWFSAINVVASFNIWHHIAVTVSGTSLTVFLDGVSVSTQTWQGVTYNVTDTVILGNDQDSYGGGLSPTQAFNGRLDDLRLYGSALTSAEVLAIHQDACATCAPPPCTCSSALDVDYTSDRIPDALKDAYSSIHLNETTWEVVLSVHNVRHLYHGHVICNKVDTRSSVTTAFTPYVSSWDDNELWNSNNCSIGALDTPAASLDIDVVRFANCTKTYSMTFSLVDAAKQSSRCNIITNADDLNVGCSLTFSSVRAYDLTEPTAFLSAETSFSANLTLPRNLNNEVSNLLYATLAKCNVLNGPEFALDCRIPGNWTFETIFGVSQNIPNWIDASTCVQSQTAVATFVRCGLNNIPVGAYTEALANVSATVAGTSEVINFSLEYTLPRAASATASASLQNFIISIGMLNEKYYYAGADRATMYIHVFDTSRLQITQLDMFNANGQSYALRDYNQFQLSETSNASHFIIEFRPSAIRQDSNFYRNGPHGVNVSFLFTAASGRRMSTQEVGYVQFDGINVQPPEGATNGVSIPSDAAPAAGASSTVIVAAAAGALVLVVGIIAAVVVIVRRRKTPSAPCEQGNGDSEVPRDQV